MVVIALSGALMVSGVTWSALRIRRLEQSELDFESAPQTLTAARTAKGSSAVSARLATVKLRKDEHAVFEVCSDDAMGDAWKGQLDFVVFQLTPMKLLLRVPLDQAHLDVIKRGAHGACLALGGGKLEADSEHAIDAVWPGKPFPKALASHALRVRVLARQPLQSSDRLPVMLIAAGALLLVIGLFLTRSPLSVATDEAWSELPQSQAQPAVIALALGLAIVVAAWLASAYVGPAGPMWGLLKTAALATLQVVGAGLLIRFGLRGERQQLLALERPVRQPWIALAIAPGVGILLMVSAILCLRLVPSTGVSAIETFISWPSGMLAFGAIGVLVPLCEEVFFRGFVYRRALVFGPATAFGVTAFSFIALHAAQTWGNWGSLLSITITGLTLTALRASTGSTLIPALAHIVYNLSLTLRSL